jgi:hypothetical protein
MYILWQYITNVSRQEEKDIHSKITTFLQILGLLSNILKPDLVQRNIRLKLYKTLALPTLLYGSEIWTIKQCDKNRLRTAEMKYVLRTAEYTLLNHKRNEEILEEHHVTPLEDKLCTYRHKWFQHVHTTEGNRLPKQLLNYHPKGRRRPGRPLKRLLDDMTAETETCRPGLNSWWNMMMMIVSFPSVTPFLFLTSFLTFCVPIFFSIQFIYSFIVTVPNACVI